MLYDIITITMPEELGQYVSLKWIAKCTGMSRATVKRHLDKAGIRPAQLGDARNAALRYPRRLIARWLLQRGFRVVHHRT